VAAAAAALAVAGTGVAASFAPPPSNPRGLGDFFLGPRMARAEVVMVVGAAVHDFRIDQGRILAIRPNAIALLERDGSRQTIPIGPATVVLAGNQVGSVDLLAQRQNVLTVREGDQPAQSIYVTGRRAPGPKALGEVFFGPRTARAEVVMVVGNVVHDFRIDIGRVLSVSPTSIVLQERDGTSQVIPISTSTEVWLGNQQLTAAALAPRMDVLTVREGDQPAQTVRAAGGRHPGRRQ
jgi:hypothetical protein